MNKELKFSMKLDTGEFDRSVEKMNQKLKEVGAQANKVGQAGQSGQAGPQGEGPFMSKANYEGFYKNLQALQTKSHTAVAGHYKEQKKMMGEINKEEERRNKLHSDLEKSDGKTNKDLQERLRMTKELSMIEERIARLKNEAGKSKTNFDAARSAAEGRTQPVFVVNWPEGRGGGGGGSGGGGSGAGPAPGSKGVKQSLGRLGSSLGTIAALLSAGATLIDNYTSTPLRTTSATGAATQSVLGNQLNELARGDVVPAMAWQKERLKAMQMAEDKMKSQMITRPMQTVAGAIGGVAAGAGAGAMGGFMLGGPWGALAGGIGGGILGGVKGGGKDLLAGVSEKHQQAMMAELMEDFGKNYETMLAAEKKANPLKDLAAQYMQERYKTDLQSQRMMGMGDAAFYGRGGFLEEANKGGFTGDMRVEQAKAIQGAGGSTRAMGGQGSMDALRAARGFNLTNAGSLMGTISGGAGSDEASGRILRRILEEGVKNGLDGSDSVEELRRYSQQTAEIVSKTGAVTGMDVSAVIEGFSRFQNAGMIPTAKEQEGAKSAYDQYQQRSGQAGGRFGALQYASLTKQGLGNIDPKALGAMMEIPEKDLVSTNSQISAIAAFYDMSPSDLIKKVKMAKQETGDVAAGFNPKYRETLKKAKADRQMSFDELSKQPKDVQKAYLESELAPTILENYSTPQERAAAAQAFRKGGAAEPAPTNGAAAQTVSDRLDVAPGTRSGDQVTAAAGAAAQAFLDNFRDFKDVITPAADGVSKLTQNLILLAAVAANTPEGDRSAAIYGASQQMMSRMSAQQAAKPPTPGNK